MEKRYSKVRIYFYPSNAITFAFYESNTNILHRYLKSRRWDIFLKFFFPLLSVPNRIHNYLPFCHKRRYLFFGNSYPLSFLNLATRNFNKYLRNRFNIYEDVRRAYGLKTEENWYGTDLKENFHHHHVTILLGKASRSDKTHIYVRENLFSARPIFQNKIFSRWKNVNTLFSSYSPTSISLVKYSTCPIKRNPDFERAGGLNSS